MKGKAGAGTHILSANIQYFFGKIMVPEFTCGKVMLPFCPQLVDFGDWFTGKRRQTYASRPGNLMGLVTSGCIYCSADRDNNQTPILKRLRVGQQKTPPAPFAVNYLETASRRSPTSRSNCCFFSQDRTARTSTRITEATANNM